MRVAALAVFLCLAAPAIAQPVLEERLILTAAREPSIPEFTTTAPASPVFQTKITRSSIRDHLRDYRVRVRQDGLALQKRFAIGR